MQACSRPFPLLSLLSPVTTVTPLRGLFQCVALRWYVASFPHVRHCSVIPKAFDPLLRYQGPFPHSFYPSLSPLPSPSPRLLQTQQQEQRSSSSNHPPPQPSKAAERPPTDRPTKRLSAAPADLSPLLLPSSSVKRIMHATRRPGRTSWQAPRRRRSALKREERGEGDLLLNVTSSSPSLFLSSWG